MYKVSNTFTNIYVQILLHQKKKNDRLKSMIIIINFKFLNGLFYFNKYIYFKYFYKLNVKTKLCVPIVITTQSAM